MTLPSFAVKRPVTVLMVIVAVLVFGFISVDRLGLDMLPDMQLPIAAIVTLYPNADPASVEQDVTIPVEGAVGTVNNLRRVTSISSENVSIVITELNWGTDVNTASDDIRSKLDQLSWVLPDEAQKPMVLRMDPSQLPLLMFSVNQTDGKADLAELTRVINNSVKPQLEQLPGVGSVTVYGASNRVIEVLYDPQKLQSAGLSSTMLQQMLQFQNLSVPTGPMVEDGVRYTTKVGKPLQSAQEIADMIIGYKQADQEQANPFAFVVPQFVRLKDVATVSETYQETEGITRINGEPGILVGVLKKSGENSVSVAEQVKRELKRISPDLGIDVGYVFDQSRIITKVIASLSRNIVIGGILALLILWLFLRNVRSTLIISIAIPLSIVVTAVFMYFSDLTLNLMTLGGLGLGVGMLVDNAIVVLENIYRKRQLGQGAVDAAVEGSAQVGRAITASTLTTLAVFLPVVFLRSLAGELFEELALTVSFSLLASLLVSLTVVPLLASRYLNLGAREARLHARPNLFRRLQERYISWLGWALENKKWVFAVLLVCFLATIGIVPRLENEFLPATDEGQFTLEVTMPAGTPVPETDKVVKEVEELVMDLPELEVVSTTVGSSGGQDVFAAMGDTAANEATLTATLIDRARRDRKVGEIVEELRQQVASIEDRYAGAEIVVKPSGAMGAGFGEFMGQQISVEVKGRDYAVSTQLARQLMEKMEGAPGLVDITSSLVDTEPLLVLGINRAKALMGGLTVGQIGGEIRSARVGTTVTQVSREGESLPVVLRADPEVTDSLDDLQQMTVSSPMALGGNQAKVKLGKVLEIEKGESPVTIQRSDRQRVITITANLGGASLGEAGEAIDKLISEMEIPPGYSIRLAGAHQLMEDSFVDLRLALVLAALLVYMVMASQFESLLHPFVIIFSLPLAAIGVFWLLFITGQNLGVMAWVGMIILAGIVVNNAIVIVDFINQLREEYSLREAIIEAGKARLRPVLMTAMTTMLGLLPLALGFGEGAELQAPLAITVIGGLLTATLLTLFVIPVIYEVLEGIFGRRRNRN